VMALLWFWTPSWSWSSRFMVLDPLLAIMVFYNVKPPLNQDGPLCF
jgi:hypothetical protein